MSMGTTSSGTLARELLPRRGILEQAWAWNTLLVVGGSLFVTLCAYIRIPLPFSPVPVTAQTMGVLLIGSLLGSRLGFITLLFYFLQGLIGLPVFAGGEAGWTYIQGATLGYLVAFPLAAALTGWLAERGWDRRVHTMVLSMVLGSLVIYGLGVAWLSTLVGLQTALVVGMLVFIPGDIVKVVLASIALPGGWRLLGKRGSSQS